MIAVSAIWDGWPGFALLLIVGVLCFIGEKLSTISSTLGEINDSLRAIQSSCEELTERFNAHSMSEYDPNLYDS